MNSALRLPVAAWLVVWLALGCERAPTAATTAACASLTSVLCRAAGPDSATCAELGSAIPLLPEAACRAGLEHAGESIARLEARAAQCRQLVERLCGDLGAESTACRRVRADAAGLPTDRCALMLAHYEATLASIREEDAAGGPLDENTRRAIAAGDAPGFGPRDAAVVIVAFVDFECPFCARAAPILAQLRDRYGDRVRLVVRQFPLELHANAHAAAQAALAAHAQGRFWELQDRLYAHQASLDRGGLERAAAEAKLDVGAFRAALDERRFAAAVDADVALGRRAAVTGTPTLFVDGVRIEDATHYQAIARLIDAALGA